MPLQLTKHSIQDGIDPATPYRYGAKYFCCQSENCCRSDARTSVN